MTSYQAPPAPKPTAKERYTQYFWEEYERDPSVPPSRTVISQKMGWKSPNHSGEMPQIRRDLLTEAGFVLIGNRYRKGTFVEELHGYRVGDQTYRASAYATHGEIRSIALAGEREQFTVAWHYTHDGETKTYAQPVTLDDLAYLVLPDSLEPDAVERWLNDA
jgi:hypothetical protein